MERSRLAFFVAVAAFAGLALGYSLLEGESADAILVHVTNLGGHNSAIRVDVGSPGGDGYAEWIYSLAPGSERTDRLGEPPAGQISIRVTAEWSAPADEGRGTARWALDARECAGTVRVDFDMDSTVGITFPRIDDECEA